MGKSKFLAREGESEEEYIAECVSEYIEQVRPQTYKLEFLKKGMIFTGCLVSRWAHTVPRQQGACLCLTSGAEHNSGVSWNQNPALLPLYCPWAVGGDKCGYVLLFMQHEKKHYHTPIHVYIGVNIKTYSH